MSVYIASHFYLASRFSNFRHVQELADFLEGNGFHVVSTWHEALGDDYGLKVTDWAVDSKRDIREISESDTVLVYSFGTQNTPGGVHVEMGVGLGMGKRVIVVGPRMRSQGVNVGGCLRRRCVPPWLARDAIHEETFLRRFESVQLPLLRI